MRLRELVKSKDYKEKLAMLKLLEMTEKKSKNAIGILETFAELRDELKSNEQTK
jgi:hypothetical protein